MNRLICLFLYSILSLVDCSWAFSVINSHRVARKPSFVTSLDMFTGIVEEMGTVVSLQERDDMVLWDGSKGKGTELVVEADVVMEGAYLG